MKYFLGIDQGSTKTAALVVDLNGNILGTGFEEGLTTVYFKDVDGFYMNRILNACQQASVAAGISLNKVTALCGGLSGADWDFEYPILTERLSHMMNISDVIVINDCIAAMRGGSTEKNCAVICAGTMLNAAVRGANGRQIIYGYFIDRAYSGASALGTAALRKVMGAYLEINDKTLLTELILSHTGYESAELLMIDISMGKYQLETKMLAPLLLRAHAAGDYEATAIVDEFCCGVARYITAGMSRLEISGKVSDIVFSGSVFKDIGMLVAGKIFDIIASSEPCVRKVYARYEPVCGAALTLLDREYGGEIPDEVKVAFDKSAVSQGLLRDPSGGGQV